MWTNIEPTGVVGPASDAPADAVLPPEHGVEMGGWCGARLGRTDTLKNVTFLRGNSSVLANDELSALPRLTEAMADLG